MKRQELKDRLIGIADGINATSHGIHLITHLEDLVDLIRQEGLEGEVRESGLKVTLGDLSVTVPTGNTGRGGVQTHRGGVRPAPANPMRDDVRPPSGPSGGSDAVAAEADPLLPSWMADGQVGLKPAFPEGPRMEFPVSGTDQEVDIASVCVRALDALPPEDRKRVARYLADRFGVE